MSRPITPPDHFKYSGMKLGVIQLSRLWLTLLWFPGWLLVNPVLYFLHQIGFNPENEYGSMLESGLFITYFLFFFLTPVFGSIAVTRITGQRFIPENWTWSDILFGGE